MKRYGFIITTIIFILLCFIAIFLKKEIEADMLKTLLPDNVITSEDIVPVANKTSSVIKVVFEADSQDEIKEIKNKFIEKIDKNYFEINKYDFSDLINKYIKTPENFLSAKTRTLLKNGNYDEVYNNSKEALYNPSEIQLTTMDKDPFLLFNDFILSNQKIKFEQNYIDGKYYDYLSLKIKNNQGLSPDFINKKISALTELQKNINKDSGKIYLAGSPIHSYHTSIKAKFMINLICILSTLFIIGLTYYYFRSLKPLLLMFTSILFGFITGYIATNLWFSNFQIITMVFSATIIGIGIDYSYHRLFCETDNKNIIKNLTYSLITTIIPFILLYYTHIELLKQIAVFTVFGLFAIYLVVVLLYPCFEMPKPVKNIKLNYKYLKYIFIIICILSTAGYFNIKFNDSLTSLYTPSKKLLQAEMLYNKISGEEYNNAKIILVKGNNFDDIIKNEEKITNNFDNTDYISISKFLPSIQRQKENYELVKKLYEKELKNYSEILTNKQIKELINTKFSPVTFNKEDYPFIKEFLLNENKSIIFIFGNENISLKSNKAEIINLKTDIEGYMKKYRQTLMLFLPAVILLLFTVAAIIYKTKNAAKIITPSLVGILTSLGLTGMLFGEINFFCIISLYLILGFTMDYSIFRNSKEKNYEDSIFTAALTTSISFLLLSFTGFKLLSVMAIVLFFGIITSYITGYLIFRKNSCSE